MNLVYVLDTGYSNLNGVPHATQGNIVMLRRLFKYFDHITVLSRNRSDLLKDEYKKIEMMNIEIVELKDFESITDYLKVVNYNKKIIKESVKYADVVFGLGFNGSLAIKIGKSMGKKCVGYIGGCGLLSYKNSNNTKEKIKSLALYMKQLSMAKKADNMQYVARFLEETYKTRGKTLIASSIKIPQLGDDIKNKRFNKEYTNLTSIKIGIIGYTHTPIKGIDTAIRSLSELEDKFTLQVVGRGDHSWLDKISKEVGVSERVEFLGALPGGERVWDWLDTVDIYIQPSISEGMPRATIEAMFRGCPVIASNVGGLCELVKEEWRIKPGDNKNLALLIKRLASSNKIMHKSMNESFDMSENFTEDILEEKYNNFWGGIIESLAVKS